MKILKFFLIQFAVVALITAGAGSLHAERGRSVINTPHNLSTGGGKGAHDIKSISEGRICIFCHSPHHASSVTPLWSRQLSDNTYNLYKPASMVATILQPRGPSRLCLSCHDGTIALGLLAGNAVLDPTLTSFNAMPRETDPRKNPDLGTDISDDHPISFEYTVKPELQDPSVLRSMGIKLDQDTYVECTSCHDAHNNLNGNFLVTNVDTQHDALCTLCHSLIGWATGDDSDTAHKNGGNRFTQQVADQVKADGCINCHLPHSAPGPVALQKGAKEEETCYLSCHNGAPYTNIRDEFNNIYRHSVQDYDKLHTVTESLPLSDTNKHVECVDCHNPHQAGWRDALLDSLQLPQLPSQPLISGPLRGVRVDNTGRTADYEFEICFKCHGGSYAESFASNSTLRPSRQFDTYKEDERFSYINPSFHPVMIDRIDSINAGRSLKADYQNTMKRIYCTDCHAPHGSNVPHILKMNLFNEDTYPSIASEYPLCYSCHDKDYLLNPGKLPHSDSITLHRTHVEGSYTTIGADPTRKVPCASCHDPHGVPASRGASSSNGAHLINFDTRYTGATPTYDSTARSCSVAGTCHTLVAPLQTY
jgi:predicted CXXCH cytochrome family protein